MTSKPNTATKKSATAKSTAAPAPTTKTQKLLTILRHKGGQEIGQLTAALGWQPHTVRAAITGLRKSGVEIEYVPKDGDKPSRYRIVAKSSAQQ